MHHADLRAHAGGPPARRVRPTSVIAVEPMQGWADDMLVSFDGQTGITLAEGERVEVQRCDTAVFLVRLDPLGYFSRLRDKLHWGDLSEREIER